MHDVLEGECLEQFMTLVTFPEDKEMLTAFVSIELLRAQEDTVACIHAVAGWSPPDYPWNGLRESHQRKEHPPATAWLRNQKRALPDTLLVSESVFVLYVVMLWMGK